MIQYGIDDFNTLRIYDDNTIIAEISDVRPDKAEEMVDEILHEMGYPSDEKVFIHKSDTRTRGYDCKKDIDDIIKNTDDPTEAFKTCVSTIGRLIDERRLDASEARDLLIDTLDWFEDSSVIVTVRQEGTISIPTKELDDYQEYIDNHWDEINFNTTVSIE